MHREKFSQREIALMRLREYRDETRALVFLLHGSRESYFRPRTSQALKDIEEEINFVDTNASIVSFEKYHQDLAELRAKITNFYKRWQALRSEQTGRIALVWDESNQEHK